MAFKEMKFRGKSVFVDIDNNGAVLAEKGRARMKYNIEDDRIYNPNVSNITEVDGAPIRTAVASNIIAPSNVKRTQRNATPKGSPAPSPSNDPDAVIAYTDGACSGNPGPAGLGYVLRFPDGRVIQRGEPLGTATNNIAELTAILRVLQSLDDTNQKVVIHTDSSYSLGLLTKGWKAKANVELVHEIRRVLRVFPNATFVKVKGHAGVPDNELVDRLAREAAELQTDVEE